MSAWDWIVSNGKVSFYPKGEDTSKNKSLSAILGEMSTGKLGDPYGTLIGASPSFSDEPSGNDVVLAPSGSNITFGQALSSGPAKTGGSLGGLFGPIAGFFGRGLGAGYEYAKHSYPGITLSGVMSLMADNPALVNALNTLSEGGPTYGGSLVGTDSNGNPVSIGSGGFAW
jgi:hypothetical protein